MGVGATSCNTGFGERTQLVPAGQERKMEDDEIVEALNRYTDNLQSSLSVLSSVGN